MMIAATAKNGKTARLGAEYHIDVGEAYYTVSCEGYDFEFGEFAPAARVYKDLSRRIEAGGDVKALLRNIANGARVFGYKVREVA